MPAITDLVGRILGKRYRLLAALGAGASARVFLAEDVLLRRRVAIKLLQPGLGSDEAFLERFRSEARAVASLNHPHVLRVFDWGEDEDEPFLVLEYLGGGSLLDLLARGARLSPAQAAVVGGQAARGLGYAHARGVVHRDVKPANLLFDEEGRVRVTDFGVARALAESALTEPAGTLVGTARYASPEQARAEPVDGRSDVYSLALVLYEAVTGSVPFAADTTVGTLMARVGRSLPQHPALGPLQELLARAAAPEVADRLDAAGLAGELEALAATLPPPEPLPLAPPVGIAGPRTEGFVPAPPGTKSSVAAVAPTTTPVGAVSAEGTSIATAPLGAVGPSAPGMRDAPVLGTAPVAETRVPQRVVAGPGELFDVEELASSTGTATNAATSRRWRALVVAMIIVALLCAGVVAAWKEQLFTPSHPVPALLGLSVTEAEHALAKDHFTLATGPSVFSTTVAPRHIVSQHPGPRIAMKQGGVVTVVLSKGPPFESFQSLAGLDCDAAVRVLAEAHLKGVCPSQAAAYSDTVPAGQVINWSWDNKLNVQRAPYGSTVIIAISLGPAMTTIPSSLVGETASQAQAALQQLGFTVSQSSQSSTTIASGDVITTSPAPGTSVRTGSTVTLIVSSGPALVKVPDVTGETVQQATTDLENAGFVVGGPYGPNPSNKSKVVLTTPSGGAMALQGSTVDLYVA